jgi:hypothetical protein
MTQLAYDGQSRRDHMPKGGAKLLEEPLRFIATLSLREGARR